MLCSVFSRKPFAIICFFLSLLCCYAKAEEAKSHDIKTRVHSFDVFDTLLGRLHKDPLSVFHLVEKRCPFPGFAKLRIEAGRFPGGTLDDIYRHLVAKNNLSLEEAEKLRAFELETEISNVFPIASNLSKVQDGDILVSDTYYNREELSQILKKIGLDKRIHLFATSHGKLSGYIWPQLKKEYEIVSHLGDNPRSDVVSPGKHGIEGVLCQKNQYTYIEQNVCNMGQRDLAHLMRVLRLTNPYPEGSVQGRVWNEQARFNVPILVLSSLSLNAFCQNRGITTLLFSSRGCCHFIKIFRHLFPDYTSIYFHTSRYAYRNPTPEFVRYVQSLYSTDSLIVDEYGSGVSCQEFFTKYLSITPNYITVVCRSRSLPPPHISVKIGPAIEHVNIDRIGHLISFDRSGPVRVPLEYELKHVQPAHDCIDKCLSLLDQYVVDKFDGELLNLLLRNLDRSSPALKPYYVDSHCE